MLDKYVLTRERRIDFSEFLTSGLEEIDWIGIGNLPLAMGEWKATSPCKRVGAFSIYVGTD